MFNQTSTLATLQKIAAQVPGMLFQYEITPDGKTRVPFASNAVTDIFGCTPEDVADDFSPIMNIIHPDDKPHINAATAKSAQKLTPLNLEYRILRPGQPVHWVLTQSSPERLSDGTILFSGFNADITEQKQLEAKLRAGNERFRLLFSTSPDAILISNERGELLEANPSAEQLFGLSEAELKLLGCDGLTDPAGNQLSAKLNDLRKSGNHEAEFSFRRADNTVFPAEIRFTLFIDTDSSEKTSIFIHDATKRKHEEELLRQSAIKDELTGLFNRHYFEMIIDKLMQHADRYTEPLSMLLLDIDHFKQVNDTWGHPVGDELLKQVSDTINKTIRNSDILVRFGGEEFIILMPQTNLKGALTAAEKIRRAIEQNPLPSIGTRTASLGVAERLQSESFRHWYIRVDEALYRAKQTGRNRVTVSDGNDTLSMIKMGVDWRTEWESGNAGIDCQHQELFIIGNRLLNRSLGEADPADIARELKLLLNHISYHFASEEKILELYGYPELKHHAQCHSSLTAKALTLKAAYEADSIKASAFFSFLLDDVLLGHLLKEDVKFFSYIRKDSRPT